jgi:hypothetical protein
MCDTDKSCISSWRTLHQLHRRLARTSPNPHQAWTAALRLRGGPRTTRASMACTGSGVQSPQLHQANATAGHRLRSSVSRSQFGTYLGGCSPRRSTPASRWGPTQGLSATIGRRRRPGSEARPRSIGLGVPSTSTATRRSLAGGSRITSAITPVTHGRIGGAGLRLGLDRLQL